MAQTNISPITRYTAMGKLFARSKAGGQSQDQRGHHSVPSIATSSSSSIIITYVQNKEAPQKAPQSSTSGAVTAKEHELGQRLQENEVEILELRARCTEKISQKEQVIQSLLEDRATLIRAVEERDEDMLERSKVFRDKLKENHQMVEDMRGRHEEDLSSYRNRQEDSKLLQRKADARARVLQESLTKAEQELETCRDDLFRTQPVCQISDASIIDAFESVGEQLVNWIDDHASVFEYVNPDVDVGSKFLLKCPSAGEYFCRHIVNRYLVKHIFGPSVFIFGLPSEYKRMLATIEQGMAALRPPRDSQRIQIWRAETLSALAATQGYTDLKKEQSRHVTAKLFACLAATFPNLDGEVEARRDFHGQVTVPAMAIVSKLQGLASTFTLDMASEDVPNCSRITRKDLKRITAIDLKTGKALKHGSAIVGDREGAIGDYVLPLEPGLRRVKERGSAVDLRKETWLMRLDDSL